MFFECLETQKAQTELNVAQSTKRALLSFLADLTPE